MNSFKSCYKCPDRWVDTERGTRCHASCEKYLKEKAKHDEATKAYKQSLRPIIREGAFLGDDGLAKFRPNRKCRK